MREKENSDRLEWIQQHVQCDGLAEVTMVSLAVGRVGWGGMGCGRTPRNCVTRSARGEGERKLVIDWS